MIKKKIKKSTKPVIKYGYTTYYGGLQTCTTLETATKGAKSALAPRYSGYHNNTKKVVIYKMVPVKIMTSSTVFNVKELKNG